MALDNRHIKRSKRTAEISSVFDKNYLLNVRINMLEHEQYDLGFIIPLPQDVKQAAAGQAGKVTQQNTEIELPAEITQQTDIVAWAQDQRNMTQEDMARQAVEQIHAGGDFDVALKASEPETVVKSPIETPQVAAARQAITDMNREAA